MSDSSDIYELNLNDDLANINAARLEIHIENSDASDTETFDDPSDVSSITSASTIHAILSTDESSPRSNSSDSDIFQPVLQRRGARNFRIGYTQASSEQQQNGSNYMEALPELDEDDSEDWELEIGPANNPDHDYAEPLQAPTVNVILLTGNERSPTTTTSRRTISVSRPLAEVVGIEDITNAVAEAVTSEAAAAQAGAANSSITDLTTSPSPTSPAKKRKRLSIATTGSNTAGTPKVSSKTDNDDDEDDGLTCPICLDSWEMSGEHRLVSLRCGHLFGEACIRRWMSESLKQTSVRTCPQCKSRAANKDIRYLYAKRVRAIDRTEEHRLRIDLDAEKQRSLALQTDLATLKLSHALVANKNAKLESDIERLRDMVRMGGGLRGAYSAAIVSGESTKIDKLNLPKYRLYMERNFEITKEPGCRVMVYASQQRHLITSQKSTLNLFPGYGVRFIDTTTFRPLNFLHTTGKIVRDICLSADQQLLAVTSQETRCKLFDTRTFTMSTIFKCDDKPIWACAMDRNERENFVYLGEQRGGVSVFDRRNADQVLSEFACPEDFSPVINISPVQASKLFPGGGFLVCKLKSLWFYEYFDGTAVPTRLNVEGPFLSLNYDTVQETLLISARSNQQYSQSRFMLGKLTKMDETTIFEIKVTFFGSKPTPIMTRAGQIPVESNTLIVGYMQDTKQLVLFDALREERSQTMPINETVYDTCPIFSGDNTYLAALTDCKCRIYKLNSSNMPK